MDWPASCDLVQMAALLGIGLPALAAWVCDHPDLPVLVRGIDGHGVLFDPRAVLAWLDQRLQQGQPPDGLTLKASRAAWQRIHG